jgi:NAD(P)-dependent dehydrogenase (short-subunit alcohol dehydrogenase family)
MADLEGKFVVVTGANTGIGAATAKELAGRGAEVVLACRSRDKTEPVLGAIRAASGRAEFAELNLGSFASVRACADALVAKKRPIDVLLNNAGVAGQRGATADGFELAFGTNHLGHFLLTLLLMPLLKAAKVARIVNVSSASHYQATGMNFDEVRRPTRTVTGLPEYAVSKLANVLFTNELARRLGGSGVRSYAVHPGTVASDAWRRIPWPLRELMKLAMITNEEGARTSVFCATSPDVAEQSGLYYDKERVKTPSKLAQDAELARALWEKSVAWTGVDLPKAAASAQA